MVLQLYQMLSDLKIKGTMSTIEAYLVSIRETRNCWICGLQLEENLSKKREKKLLLNKLRCLSLWIEYKCFSNILSVHGVICICDL